MPSVKQVNHGSRFLYKLCCGFGLLLAAPAQSQPEFTLIEQLSNAEVRLSLTASPGFYRVDASTNLSQWAPVLTLQSAGLRQFTDSAAPFLPARFYRAEEVGGANIVTGDHLSTTNGDVVIHPHRHATTLLTWNGLAIYADPDDDNNNYAGLPLADLIVVTHAHGDHYNIGIINSLSKAGTIILAPQAVYNAFPASLRTLTTIMGYGAVTNALGVKVEVVPAYNGNHPFGSANGYVLTLGGQRIYFSGDTGNTSEMRALQNIDVAFVCMNLPWTMSVSEATNAVHAFRPRIIYPYHYRNQNGSTANAATFKQSMGTDSGIEVRLRDWY